MGSINGWLSEGFSIKFEANIKIRIMVVGIALLVAGIFLGYLIRKRRGLILAGARLTDAAIFLLLFFLGVSVGMNKQVVNNFSNIGLQSFLLTLMATDRKSTRLNSSHYS